MNKIMLVGEWKSGKSSLIRCLSDGNYQPRKVFALDYYGRFINTPSEFLENRRFYPSLITASADCDALLFVQAADRRTSQLPPKFASMFNRLVLGVVTKTDLPTADVALARRFLENAGVRRILNVSIVTGEGLEELRDAIGA